MSGEKFNKIKRVVALIGVVVLVSLYIVSFVAALSKSEHAHAIFMTSMYCSFVIPVIIYILQMIYKLSNKDDENKK